MTLDDLGGLPSPRKVGEEEDGWFLNVGSRRIMVVAVCYRVSAQTSGNVPLKNKKVLIVAE
jgi:hypothetical protein